MIISGFINHLAQSAPATIPASQPPLPENLATWILLLGAMALLPFILTMVTSFAKIVVVGSILRQALGTPQIPPTSVITGLALILTIHIMAPVAVLAYRDYAAKGNITEEKARIEEALKSVRAPLEDFLRTHSSEANRELFTSLRSRLFASAQRQRPDAVDWVAAIPNADARSVADVGIVLIPAFILTELIEAFQIGFLIFLPFLIIDLVVSNILLAMGMHMLSPATIALPLKLLLFVMVDGWTLIFKGIVLGYT